MTAGMIFVGAYCARLMFFNLDVNLAKHKDPAAPMSGHANRRFKWFNPLGADYAKPNQAFILESELNKK